MLLDEGGMCRRRAPLILSAHEPARRICVTRSALAPTGGRGRPPGVARGHVESVRVDHRDRRWHRRAGGGGRRRRALARCPRRVHHPTRHDSDRGAVRCGAHGALAQRDRSGRARVPRPRSRARGPRPGPRPAGRGRSDGDRADPRRQSGRGLRERRRNGGIDRRGRRRAGAGDREGAALLADPLRVPDGAVAGRDTPALAAGVVRAATDRAVVESPRRGADRSRRDARLPGPRSLPTGTLDGDRRRRGRTRGAVHDPRGPGHDRLLHGGC